MPLCCQKTGRHWYMWNRLRKNTILQPILYPDSNLLSRSFRDHIKSTNKIILIIPDICPRIGPQNISTELQWPYLCWRRVQHCARGEKKGRQLVQHTLHTKRCKILWQSLLKPPSQSDTTMGLAAETYSQHTLI